MPEMKFCPYCSGPLEAREIEGRERLACTVESCDFVFWNNPTPVVAAIVEHQGDIVLARNRNWPPDWFGLVTGFLEKRETPEAAVLREVEEELGLSGEIEELVGIYPFHKKNELIIAYHVRARGEISLGEELVEIKRTPPDDLKPWPFGTGLAVRDWLKRRKSQ